MLQISNFKRRISRIVINKYLFIFSCILISLFILSSNLLTTRKLYVSGIFVCAVIITINFVLFEKKKLDNKKLTLICTFISIGTISRCALYFVSFIKPLTSIIILASIFLDPTESFFTGSMSMLISNVFLGQGPWTFWQMVAAGLVGAFSSFIFNKAKFKTSNTNLSLVATVCVYLIYSPIMNISSFMFMLPDFSMSLLISYLITCLANDISHLTVTMVILISICNMTKKYILNT